METKYKELNTAENLPDELKRRSKEDLFVLIIQNGKSLGAIILAKEVQRIV